MTKHFLAPLVPLIFFSHFSPGQVTTGDLQARIVDTSGTPLPGANFVVRGDDIQGLRGSVSDSLGFVSVLFIPPGRAQVRISHLAFQTVELQDVSIRLGNTTNLGDITLRPGSIDMPEIIVSGGGSFADASKSSTGLDLQSSDFEKLPIERNYRSIATLAPQANASFLDDEVNISGATGRENKYFVDGMEVTDPSFGRAATTLPYNFVKEIQVSSGWYEAEHRSALGGLLNVVTYSGSNEFHGSAFAFFTNNSLSAPRRGGLLDPTEGGFSSYDVGLGIGGPIIPDQLWFFAAYNPTFNRRNVDLPGIGTYLDRTTTNSFAAKATWRASQRLSLVLASSGDPSVRTAVGNSPPVSGNPVRLANPDPYLTDKTEGGVNVSLDGSYIVTDKILLNASMSRIARDERELPSTEVGRRDTVLIDTETGLWSGGGFGHNFFFRSRTTARTNATVLAGSHTFKAGIEYGDIRQVVDNDGPITLYRHSDTSYSFLENGTHGTVDNRIASVYLQDGWQPSPHLQVHAGMRWDGQWIIGSNGKTVHVVNGPLQPRVGMVWLPSEGGRQKIFGSWGRFSQEWSSAVMTIYTGNQYFANQNYSQDPRVAGFRPVPFAQIPDKTILEGQHYDEFTLGFEQLVGRNIQAGIQATYRSLREAINAEYVLGTLSVGNPGSGVLSDFPSPRRDYTAIGLTVQSWGNEHVNFLASYVLSRDYGNYEGLYDSYNRNIVPNVNFTYSDPAGLKNANGLLPNDRTHVFKFAGSYRFDIGLTVGTSFVWQTGTPLSDMASLGTFVRPRGSVGRTPAIWDLGARCIYFVPLSAAWQTKLILDAYHIASRREPVDFVQEHYFGVDERGNPYNPNPTYGVASRHQPPMSVRLGFELGF